MTKRCPGCKAEKAIELFDSQKQYCRDCHAANSRRWRASHRRPRTTSRGCPVPLKDGHKWCPRCREQKPIERFGKIRSYCLKCQNLARQEWQRANLDKVIKYIAGWKKTDRGKQSNRASAARYRARKAGASGSHTVQEWLDLLERYGHRCAHCGTGGPMTRDHIIPLSKGGTDYIGNIQPLCNRCNARKNNRILPHVDVECGAPS